MAFYSILVNVGVSNMAHLIASNEDALPFVVIPLEALMRGIGNVEGKALHSTNMGTRSGSATGPRFA